jgi:hypothetical protein
MNEPLDQQIRARIARYLRGESDLREFHRWFMPVSWDALQTADPELKGLVGSVSLLLSEYSAGHATEQELRDEFFALLKPDVKHRSSRSRATSQSTRTV